MALVSISRSARSRSGASSARSRLDADQRRLVRAQRVPAPGLAVTLQQGGRLAVEIDQHRRAPRHRGDLVQGRQHPLEGEVAVARVDPDRHRPLQRPAGEQPRQEADRHVVDRLEAEILERADRGRPAGACRPGDDRDFLCLLRASCLCHRVPRARQTVRACLNRERRGRSARQSSIPGQDLGGRGRKSIRDRPRGTELSHPVAFVPRRRRSRSTASVSTTSDCAGSPMSPRPRASISPAIAAGARATSADPRRSTATPSSATSAAPRPISSSASADLPAPEAPENQHAAAAEGHHRAVQDRRAPPPPPSAAVSLWRNAKATEHRSQQDMTPGPALLR